MDYESADVVLAKKLKLINNAIDEIGFTPYHLKLFFLNGMGYATDSQLFLVESSVRTYINYQFGQTFPYSNEALAIGGIAGACFGVMELILSVEKLPLIAHYFYLVYLLL